MSALNTTIQDAYPRVLINSKLHLDSSLGAVFIGLIFSAILFGVTNVQTLIYYQNFPRDPMMIRWTIAILWILDAFHLAITSQMLYVYMVTDFTNFLAITKPTWTSGAQVIVTATIVGITRVFYARRLWIMSRRNRILTFGLPILSAVGIGAAVVIGIKLISYKSTFDLTRISWLIYSGLAQMLSADLWCALPLCYYLCRDRTGFRTTNAKINTLIMYIISTGLLTSLVSLGCFVAFATMPHTFVFMAFHFCLSGLYFNALLAMLNARNHLNEDVSARGLNRQVPQIIHINPLPSSKHQTTFGTLDSNSDTPGRSESSLGELGDKTNPDATSVV